MNFVDVAKISVRSGKGGNGLVSFRREKYVPKGGPDGGNGGKGGDIVFRADRQLTTLLDFRYTRNIVAEDGRPGEQARRTGRSGKDRVIKVPAGTIVRDEDSGDVLADLTTDKQEVVIARGGRGGRGNAEFHNSVNQTPRHSEPGGEPVELNLSLELKIIADVGIVGYPNAGKSTLISVISAAKPKIADYPFTTLVPNLGMVFISDEKSYAVADIPGLIEGAHLGKGLGHQFLRHVERTRVLVVLVDSMSEDPVADYKVLVRELKKYNPELAKRKKVLCLSKVDAIDDERRAELVALEFPNRLRPMLLSAVAGEGVDELKMKLWKIIEKQRDADIANEPG